MAKVHPFEALRAVDFLEQFELQEERFELGAGEAPLDATDQSCELQAALMPR